MNYHVTVWDIPANVETLKAMWAEGKSASDIAFVLGQGISRSSVIGKVHRLKLPERRNPAVAKPRVTRPTPTVTGRKGRSGNPGVPSVRSILHRAEGREKIAPRLDLVQPNDEGVDVTHLLGFADRRIGHQCSWVHADPLDAGSGFCGKPVKPGTEWCPEHHARVYKKGSPNEEQAG